MGSVGKLYAVGDHLCIDITNGPVIAVGADFLMQQNGRVAPDQTLGELETLANEFYARYQARERPWEPEGSILLVPRYDPTYHLMEYAMELRPL